MAAFNDVKVITELSEALKEKDAEIFQLKRHVTSEGCVCSNFNKSKVVDFTKKLKAVIENQKKEIGELKHEKDQLKDKNEFLENEAKIDQKVLEQFVEENGVFRDKITKFEVDKKERVAHLNHLAEISEKTKDHLEDLKQKVVSCVQPVKQMKTRCKFGWDCRRGFFCKFDHSYLYRKVNKRLDSPFKCKLCNKTFHLQWTPISQGIVFPLRLLPQSQ